MNGNNCDQSSFFPPGVQTFTSITVDDETTLKLVESTVAVPETGEQSARAPTFHVGVRLFDSRHR